MGKLNFTAEDYNKYDTLGESEIPWAEDEPPIYSTVSPNGTSVIIDAPTSTGTIVIFVISAVLVIALIFGLAVFIDCRQEKLTQLEETKKSKKVLRIRLPSLGRLRGVTPEDEDTIADKMQVGDFCCSTPESPSSPHIIA